MNSRLGNLYWIKRGEKQRVLVLVVGARSRGKSRPWLKVRKWSPAAQKWLPPSLCAITELDEPADPVDYRVRRAMQFIDADAAAVMTGERTG